MTNNIPEVVYRNIFWRYSTLLNRTVQDESEHVTKADAVADILEQEATGYEYSHSIYFGDGQSRRVSLLFDAMLLEAEREAADSFVPSPHVGVSTIAA
jgi:hypothetical protein